jgi:hypothetical protein
MTLKNNHHQKKPSLDFYASGGQGVKREDRKMGKRGKMGR